MCNTARGDLEATMCRKDTHWGYRWLKSTTPLKAVRESGPWLNKTVCILVHIFSCVNRGL